MQRNQALQAHTSGEPLDLTNEYTAIVHAEDPQPPIRVALGSRLYTAGDLFLGALALLVLDAIVAWIVWSAFSNAVYLIAAVFAVVGLGLGVLGVAIKRRVRADGRRRHEARLILEAAGPHTEDDEIDGVVWAWLIHNKASRQVLPVSHVSFVEGIENRVGRGIARVWIVNEADGFAGRAPVMLEAADAGGDERGEAVEGSEADDAGEDGDGGDGGDGGERGNTKRRPRASVFKTKLPPASNPLPAARFSCWPTLSGKQLNEYRMDGDAGTVMLAGVFCLGFGGVALYGGSLLGVALLISGIGVIYTAVTHTRSTRMTNGWAIATTEAVMEARSEAWRTSGHGWIVRIKRRRVIEAHPIDERTLVVVTPIEQRTLLGRLRKVHRTRIVMPVLPGLPATAFEADGIDLPSIADGMGIALHPAEPASSASSTPAPPEHAET